MTPDVLKSLRKELNCTAKELAAVLEVEQSTVFAWERGELFPTKQYVDKLESLRAAGAASFPKKVRGESPMKVLADPQLWALVRKLSAHKKLRDAVTKLAEPYSDPADDAPA